MDNIKKYLNKYTYLLIGLIVLIITSVLIIIPNFQTEEFSQDVIEDIIEGVTTTSIQGDDQEIQGEESTNPSFEELEISKEQTNEITKNFKVLEENSKKIKVGFEIENLEFVNEWLLQFGKQVTILSPEELVSKRKALLKEMLDQ